LNPARLVGKNVQNLVNSATGQAIPAIVSRGLVFTCWEPSEEERKDILIGKPLWVIQRGSFIPEMVLQIGDQNMVVPNDVRMDMLTQNSDQKLMDDAAKVYRSNLWWGKLMVKLIAIALVGLAAFVLMRFL
jgi:hypothetical protein